MKVLGVVGGTSLRFATLSEIMKRKRLDFTKCNVLGCAEVISSLVLKGAQMTTFPCNDLRCTTMSSDIVLFHRPVDL
jgi:hypothetical protein